MKALVFLLTLACAGLGGFSLWQWLERGRMEKEISRLAEENANMSKMARAKAGALTSTVIRSKGPTGLEGIVPLEDEGRKEPGKEARPDAKKPEGEDFRNGLAKMMRSKESMELIKANLGAQLELQYRDLFDEMKLDPAKRDAVLAILKDRTAAQMQDGMAFMDKSVSAEEKKAATERLTAGAKDSEEKLKAALGDEAFKTFDRYEKSQPEREQLKVLNSMLKDRSLALDEATETKLMDAMYSARQEFKFDNDFTNPRNIAPDAFTDENSDKFVQQYGALQESVQAKVKDILSPEQFEVFVKSQKSQTEAIRMSMEMFRGMSGGNDGKD